MPLNLKQIADVLRDSRAIAVIGLSPVPGRPSYGVTQYMIGQGYEIYGVRPAAPEKILDRPAFDSLALLPAGVDIDIFDVFRNPEAVPGVIGEIKAWSKAHPRPKPRVVWLQEGVGHPQAEAVAEAAGLLVVSDRCILKDHAMLLKGR